MFGKLVPTWMWLAAIAALVVLLGVQQLRITHAQSKYSKLETAVATDKAERAAAALEATNENQRISNRWHAAELGALNASIQRQARIVADSAGASAQRERVLLIARKAAADCRPAPGPARAAGPEPANSLYDVFAGCTARLVELGKAADGHASDAQTLSDSWPK